MKIHDTLIRLKAYCERQDFAGWDPYDGLNSKVFKAIPLIGNSAIARLIWIQLFKRNPLNLRKVLRVPKQRNAKGVGLFLRGYCSLWRAVDADCSLSEKFGAKQDLEIRIKELADWLVANVSSGYSGACWGYNFPWQCRREFLFPAYEPTVVATYFCATALLDAFEITGDIRYRDIALSSSEFVKRDLRRYPYGSGVILSYSKMPGNDTIFNASLLGSALLARCYCINGDVESADLARQSVDACCYAQAPDGSWTYGVKSVTGWIDSFHTGYNLMALAEYMRYASDRKYTDCLHKGLDYYTKTFFKSDGAPKYYHNRQYPVDIHCVGQLPVTMAACGRYDEMHPLIDKVIDWAVENMFDHKGYFYYQQKKGMSSKISYMRWSNAFMFAALACAIKEETGRKADKC